MKLDKGMIDDADIAARFWRDEVKRRNVSLMREIYRQIVSSSDISIRYSQIHVNIGRSFSAIEIMDLIREDLDKSPDERDVRKRAYEAALRAMADDIDKL